MIGFDWKCSNKSMETFRGGMMRIHINFLRSEIGRKQALIKGIHESMLVLGTTEIISRSWQAKGGWLQLLEMPEDSQVLSKVN